MDRPNYRAEVLRLLVGASLANDGMWSVKGLIQAMVDKESVVRHGAANALQIINFQWRISEEAQKAIPFLEAAQKDEEYWVREAATKARARIRAL